MSGFYDDDEKITFDRGEVLAERYIRTVSDRRSRVTSKDVARHFEIETSHHNLIRIEKALDKKLELVKQTPNDPKQYKLP